jgi:hypothetical protein
MAGVQALQEQKPAQAPKFILALLGCRTFDQWIKSFHIKQ